MSKQVNGTQVSVVLTRTAVAVAAALLVSSVAYAQSAEGTIYGTAKAGQSIVITSVETGSSRQINAGPNGSFTAAKLQPGTYKVTADGVTQEVTVSIGSGTQVSLGAAAPQRVMISGTRSAIDVSSTESNTVFNQEQMRRLPVARDVNAVALLAPGTVEGDADLGDGSLPVFAGASVAENGYYINGFDVTNIRNFLSYSNLPFDAIGAQQIKNGGYGAEYGRALGGVISLVTKRGTNEWKGGGSVYYSPSSLQSDGKNVANKELDRVGDYEVFRKTNSDRDLSFNVYAGGPLIKDKLFIFALAEGRADRWDRYDQNQSNTFRSTQPNGMVKIDFTPNDMHRLEFTGISNKVKEQIFDYDNPVGQKYATTHVGPAGISERTSGGHTLIAKYTGYLTDNLTLSVLGGAVDHKEEKTIGARQSGLECPVVLANDFSDLGCWTPPFPGPSVRDANAPDDSDKRRAFRVDVDYTLGNHTLRAGIDSQKFTSAEAGEGYPGGAYWLYRESASGTINGVPNATTPGGTFVRKRVRQSTSGAFETKNDAFYIEDSWKVSKNVVLYGGLRSESFDNKNSDGISFVKADNLMAPRLGAAWDVMGDSSLKVYANAGRYYIPVAVNTNIRATRGELFSHNFYTYTGSDPRTAEPTGLSGPIGVPQIVGDGSLANPATIADTKLKPMSQDEYIIGFQKAIAKGWSVGAKAISRKINDGMDDYCSHLGFDRWAADEGYTNFDSSTMADCMIVNPGNDLTLQVDVQNDGVLKEVMIPAKYLGLAKYTRTYNAIELTTEKPFNGIWSLQASYTWSKSKGTAEGYVNSIINQEDAGVSQDFDFASLTDGTDGYLPNDRRHVLKAFGTYALNDNFRVGANATIASGRPLSCIGFVPHTAQDFSDARNYTTASSFYCVNDQGSSDLHQRGTFGRTKWTSKLDLQFAYTPKMGNGRLTLQADIFNVFNQQQETERDEQRDYSRETTSAVQARASLNYGQPSSFQAPRSVRFTGRYEF